MSERINPPHITVAQMIEELRNYPPDAVPVAYERESMRLIIYRMIPASDERDRTDLEKLGEIETPWPLN